MDKQVQQKVENFFSSFKRQSYKKGDILIRAEDTPSGIFYLQHGIVKQYAISTNGNELVVNTFKAPSFFPVAWALADLDNHYFYEAVTNLDVYKAPKTQLVTFFKENPDVVYDLLQRIYRGIEGIYTKLTYLMNGSAYARLLAELLIHAKRFGDNSGKQVMLHISEKDLATQTGMTRETVSRELTKLKKKNLIEISHLHLVLPDLQLLENELTNIE